MQKIVLFLMPFLVIACTPQSIPTITPTPSSGEEAQVRALVEDFGRTFQQVSLLAPDAADQIAEKYSEFVSLDLLVAWMADPVTAPGRLTSSPWPDHIEITAIEQETDRRYLVTGSVFELTSEQVENGGVAAQYGVEITVSFVDNRWLITNWVANDYQ